ncbi:preprotein translocase subunit SecE [uncultured Finegoldia sp.]|uniref:preprotein translocase subunit SecE n=1 Tax=uncultured Finegoldia sp. TaxID=328009 RepID=UPI002623DED0|nr:preprotein translocase subunit SecE [uncultured Finegoldia sp.]
MAVKNPQNSNQKLAANTKNQGFLKGVKTEWNKIVWPTSKETVEYSIVVVIISFIVALIVYGLDTVFQRIIGLFI